MKLFVSVHEEDITLREEAIRVWTTFSQAGIHPRGSHAVTMYGSTNHGVGEYAGIIVSTRGTANLVLSARLLTKSTPLEQQLTLLHECIHMDFAFGEHEERWLTIHKRLVENLAAIDAMTITNEEDAKQHGYLWNRDSAAFLFLRLPDEIVAEQWLKRKYPEQFEERAKYYVRMRQEREPEIAAPKSDAPLRLFHVFYELLRIALYIPLVAGMPALEGEHAKLKRLEKNADDRLREGEMVASASTCYNDNMKTFCREHVFFEKRRTGDGFVRHLPEVPQTGLIFPDYK